MQALFYMDIHQNSSQELLERFCEYFSPPEKTRPFFFKLVNGVLATRTEIDVLIERYSENWQLSRMSFVDRNVIRIAVYEMLYCSDIPPKVSINEAVDIGKKFGTEESGAFINGIIDSIRIELEKKELSINDSATLD